MIASLENIQDLDADRLSAWMTANVTDFAGPMRYVKFAGGQSNPTYRIDALSGSYVLRRKPFGALLPSAHAIEREFRVIERLHPTGFPVPKPHGLCEQPDVIGSPFYVMEMVEGRGYWDGTLPDASPDQRTAIYHMIVDRLADLHRIDYRSAGLADYGKPGNYFERQVSRWTRQYRSSQTDHVPEAEKLIEWLPRTLPPQLRTTIVHGDYRIDNIIFAHDTPRIRAVLDWELSTLGDPLADLSYLLMNWMTPPNGRAGVMGVTGPVTGIPTVEEITARYCARVGWDTLPDLNWYFAFCRFRLMCIVQGIRKRHLAGNASSAQAEAEGERVPFIAQSGWQFALQAGAV